MKRQDKKRTRKIRNLVFVCALCAILLSVSTYAWFIGMKTVSVSSFDISIASTEGLFLSMNGKDWNYTLDAKNSQPYENNTNTWAEDGLIPVSSVGDMDATTSTMKLFEKASLTTTRGGYRLLTSRVNNYTVTPASGERSAYFAEGKGYVAFDLFIKNLSGAEYYAINEPLNEEAIYLTTNSSVTVASNGGEANTGIENSVRVAFTQIGRVNAETGLAEDDTAGVEKITKIDCNGTEEDVTGICRNAQIWEPNDNKHVQNAINWYTTSCSKRLSPTEADPTLGSDVTLNSSYNRSQDCVDFTTSTDHHATYAISRVINIADNVDVYDGDIYNTYLANTIDYDTYSNAADKSSYKLVSYPYFTDTMKNMEGNVRPTFMTLAPNSITKLRVYIYIEGQDIDNYDFASLGKKISVNFGFTKERYNASDIDYEGPELPETMSE